MSDLVMQPLPQDPPCHDSLDECLADDPHALVCECGTPVVAIKPRRKP